MLRKLIFLLCFLTITLTGFSQVKVSGIVVDSMSFKSIPNVHIKVKNKTFGFVTDEKGYFDISVKPFDTLLFSTVGYISFEFPVLVNEEDIIVMMSEDVTYLQTIVVTGAKIQSPLIQERKDFVYRQPKAAKLVTGSGISFDYFSKLQKERRKLAKLIEANDKVKAYATVVSDPDFKDETMKKYKLIEETYYQLILKFNLNNIHTIEWKDEETVLRILDNYFCMESDSCR